VNGKWKGGTIIQNDDNEGVLNPIVEENKVKFTKGGKYVKIKDKCGKYNNEPHCSQGAIDDPLILSDDTIKNIQEIAKQTGRPFNEVYRIVINSMK
jgi:hypothetical protein